MCCMQQQVCKEVEVTDSGLLLWKMKMIHISKEVFHGNISVFLASLVRKGFFVPCWNIQVGASFLQPHEVVNSTFAWSEFHIQHLLWRCLQRALKVTLTTKTWAGRGSGEKVGGRQRLGSSVSDFFYCPCWSSLNNLNIHQSKELNTTLLYCIWRI